MSRVPSAFSCTREFLDMVDARAKSLGMNRSQYIVQVLRQDLLEGKRNLLVVGEDRTQYVTKKRAAKKGDKQ